MKTTTQPAPVTLEARHAHRWRIDEPAGPMSIGRCSVCGALRDFKNWLSEGDFVTNEEHRSLTPAPGSSSAARGSPGW